MVIGGSVVVTSPKLTLMATLIYDKTIGGCNTATYGILHDLRIKLMR